MTRVNAYPLLIEFVSGTRITREPEVVSKLPILQNGPPGTSVVFGDGAEVPLPTDQIVFADDGGGAAHVGFGGMSFEGIEGGQLVFLRVRDLQPEALLSPQRGRRMTLEPQMVASIAVDGRILEPRDPCFAAIRASLYRVALFYGSGKQRVETTSLGDASSPSRAEARGPASSYWIT